MIIFLCVSPCRCCDTASLLGIGISCMVLVVVQNFWVGKFFIAALSSHHCTATSPTMELTIQALIQALDASSSQTSCELRKQGEAQLETYETAHNFHSLLQVSSTTVHPTTHKLTFLGRLH